MTFSSDPPLILGERPGAALIRSLHGRRHQQRVERVCGAGFTSGQSPNVPVRKGEQSAKPESPELPASRRRSGEVVYPRRRQSGWLLRRWMGLRKLLAVGLRTL